ncbi:hypothetical protein Poly30_53550 [Planctomycetes bacterium Poly30]|uniref:T9SS-like galactose binding domain-containing protein n=1 Tax=Saltatorellus ferox TaxID=2528018 RepID=A0A518F0E0_9BACT|nr:hypothetical protein Poly30_53550 [Planctomycetes bacterium Poly30]
MRLTLASSLFPAALIAGVASAQVMNDDCSTALPISIGLTTFDSAVGTGATDSLPAYTCEPTQGRADIWYSFNAPNNAVYLVELCGTTFDTVLEVLEGACGSQTAIVCNDDTCGTQSIVSFQATAGTTYYIRPGGWGGATGMGIINIEEIMPVAPPVLAGHWTLDEPGAIANDFSGNNQPGIYSATMNSQPGIAGNSVRFDGTSSYVEITSAPALDALRYDFTAMAWINVDQTPTGGMRILSNDGPSGSWSFSVSQFGLSATTHAVLDYGANPGVLVPGTWHHVAISMSELADVTFYFDGVQSGNVAMGEEFARDPNSTWFLGAWDPNFSIPQFFNGRMDDVQVYAGQLSPADIAMLYANPGTTLGGGFIGSQYCATVPNSTGASGELTGAGSVQVSLNDVTLVASDLPALSFGFFIVSPNQGFVMGPGGSSGNLCLSGQIGRYVGPGQIKQSNAMGTFQLGINLGAIPSPTGFVSANSGDTFNFQTWYRDTNGSGGTTSNFTNGLEITFF